eukprot:gene2362-2691_t
MSTFTTFFDKIKEKDKEKNKERKKEKEREKEKEKEKEKERSKIRRESSLKMLNPRHLFGGKHSGTSGGSSPLSSAEDLASARNGVASFTPTDYSTADTDNTSDYYNTPSESSPATTSQVPSSSTSHTVHSLAPISEYENGGSMDNTATSQTLPSSSISTSSSSSSLRSNSANSLSRTAGKRSDSFTAASLPPLAPTTTTPATSTTNTPSSNGGTLKKSSRLKNLYHSLRFKSLRSEKHHPPTAASLASSLTKSPSSHFEFTMPATPLPPFEAQFPTLTWSSEPYFGVPLAVLVKRQDNGTHIPILAERCISFLEGYADTTKLFFNQSDNARVQLLKTYIERNGEINLFYPEIQDANDVAALLIEFIGSLPDELLNMELYKAVINHTSALNSQYGGYWDVQFLVSKLPRESIELVQRLFGLLKRVAAAGAPDAINELSELFTPLLVNHKSHSVLQPATNILIERCEDLFIEMDNRPTILPSEFVQLQIPKVIVPPTNLRVAEGKLVDVTGWEVGTLYLTNYRMCWVRDTTDETASNSNNFFLLPDNYDAPASPRATEMHFRPDQFEMPLATAIKWESVGKSKTAKSSSSKSQQTTIHLIYTKDMRFQYLGFPEDAPIDRLNAILGFYMNPIADIGRLFATVNHEVSAQSIADSSDLFSASTEATRLRLDMRRDWRVFEFGMKEPIMPRRIAMPNLVGDDVLMAYAKKSGHRIPVFSWIHPYKRALLFRVSVPMPQEPRPILGGSLSSSGGIPMPSNGLSSSLGISSSSDDVPSSPHKRRNEKTYSPLVSNRSLSKSKKRENSFSKLPIANLSDSFDIKLYQLLLNKDGVIDTLSLSTGSTGSNSLAPQTVRHSPGGSPKQSRDTSAIVFTNKLDAHFVPAVDQFKVSTGSNILFLNVAARDELDTMWHELYRSVAMFDGSADVWRTIEDSDWIDSVRAVVQGSARVAHLLEEGTSVLIKPGNDSPIAAQDVARISSLVQVLSDPYARTIEGFMSLIEKEWLAFSHVFVGMANNSFASSLRRDRAYGSVSKGTAVDDKINQDLSESMSKKSPPLFDAASDPSTTTRSLSTAFCQFIDAVWQVQRQFPFHFEFNEQFLVFLIGASFNGRFGTFLSGESLREPERKALRRTPSAWAHVKSHPTLYSNILYKYTGSHLSPGDKARDEYEFLWPQCDSSQIVLWSAQFTANMATRDAQHISKRLVGRTKADLVGQRLTIFKMNIAHLGFCDSLTQLDLSRNFLNTVPADLILLSSLQILNLADNRIKSIPSAVLKLIGTKLQLIELNLANNLLDSLHKSICTISTLQKLVLDNNNLAIIPESLSKMAQLRILSVAHNRLTAFPQALSLMVGLEELHVANNQIRDLPLGFFKLHSLRVLDLQSNLFAKFKPHKLDDRSLFLMRSIECFKFGPNPLQKLSTTLFDMRTLTYLKLTGCAILSLPSRLYELVNLEVLLLSGNRLTEVSADIAKLTRLVTLDLGDNSLASLPSAILLPSLRNLYLHNNQIYTVSFNVALPDLQELRLDGNRITYVSPSFGRLTGLTLLNLSKNNITILPHTLGALERLRTLSVTATSLISPLREIAADGDTSSIMRHLRVQMALTFDHPRAKLIVIADPSIVSKNEVIRTLTTTAASKRRAARTVEQQKKVPKWSIELDPLDSSASKKRSTMTVYIRDLSSVISQASQHLYTKRAVYLLLWTVTENEEPTKLYRSLEHIKDRCSSATVFTLGVFADKEAGGATRDFHTYVAAKVEARAVQLFPNFSFSFHFINASGAGDSLNKLRDEMRTTFIRGRAYGSRVSSAQRLFERHLKTIAAPFVSKREIHQIGEMCGLDKIGTRTACDLLTELGLALWLDDYEWVVLDPLWLTTALSSLLTSGGVKPASSTFTKKDIIVMSSLESIWNDIPVRLYPYLLALAKKYNIAFIIETLYDPSTWGYMYAANSLITQQTSSPTLHHRSLSSSGTRGSPIKNTLSPSKFGGMLSPNRLLASPGGNPRPVSENLRLLNEKVIFLPGELPDLPPKPIDVMFPIHEPRAVGRIFVFDSKIPASFFPRLLSQLYMFCSIKVAWKSGVVLDNCYLSFPIARRYPASPNNASYRRSSTFSVLSSDDIVVIQVHEDTRSIEISSTKMCRHILTTLEAILETYNDLAYSTYIPCIHCIDPRVRITTDSHLFPIEHIELAVVKGKSYVSCPFGQTGGSVPIKLNQLAPDLTMSDLRHKLIDYNEVQLETTPIGEGGTATVYKGTWRNNHVAIKLLQTDKIGISFTKVFAEFRREIFIMSSFYHPNILDLKGFCLEPLCIITEFMSGGNLYEYIHDPVKPLDWRHRVKMAKEIASSLQTLHDCKPSVIHRDLKSPNILLSTSDVDTTTCHLCDFSLSGFSTSLTSRAVENPVWLAPEVISKESCTDKSDVYSFGVILFELLSRQHFFEGISFMSYLEQMICDGIRPQLPTHTVPEYDNLLNACWSQDAASRPSFSDILNAIGNLYIHFIFTS